MCTQILVSDCGLFLMSNFDTRDICAPFSAPCDPVSCTAISCMHEMRMMITHICKPARYSAVMHMVPPGSQCYSTACRHNFSSLPSHFYLVLWNTRYKSLMFGVSVVLMCVSCFQLCMNQGACCETDRQECRCCWNEVQAISLDNKIWRRRRRSLQARALCYYACTL